MKIKGKLKKMRISKSYILAIVLLTSCIDCNTICEFGVSFTEDNNQYYYGNLADYDETTEKFYMIRRV